MISKQQYFAKLSAVFKIITNLYQFISEMTMSLMSLYHCQDKRMWRKEVKSRLISVLGIDVFWPLKRPKSTHSFGLKFVWQHWHPFYCWFGIQYQTIWCPSNILCKLEATLWFFFSIFNYDCGFSGMDILHGDPSQLQSHWSLPFCFSSVTSQELVWKTASKTHWKHCH